MKLQKICFIIILAVTSVFTVKAQDAAANKALNNVLASYFVLKNDLAADNSAAAKTHAAELAGVVKAVATEKLNAEQQTVWKLNAPKFQLASIKLNEAKDIDAQREYFAVLSKTLADAAKALKINTSPIYVQYCPMKKVSWLSDAAAIKNPFYGKQMLTCGQVTETLAANQD